MGGLAFSQSIKGTLSASQGQKLGDLEIIFTKDQIKESTLSDDKGNFNLSLKQNGIYHVEIYKDGEKIYEENLEVVGTISKNFLLEFPTTQETKIEGVAIVGTKKKLIERKVDRLVFNIENSVASQGLDAIEALAKTPMVRATDDAITIAGKSNVAVMVNDRMLNLSGQELINYLKTLRSDDILKIEVITTPPARYEAEGKSGIINITLKTSTKKGWNGSLQTSGNYYAGRPTVSARSGASFNYQGQKLSASANLSVGLVLLIASFFCYVNG